MSLEDPYKRGGGLQHVLLLWRSPVKTSYRRSIFATAKARNAPLLSVSAGYMFCMANNVLFLYLTTRWCIVGCLASPADTTLVLCLVLCFSLPAVRRLDFGRAGGATDGDPTVPRPCRGEWVSGETLCATVLNCLVKCGRFPPASTAFDFVAVHHQGRGSLKAASRQFRNLNQARWSKATFRSRRGPKC